MSASILALSYLISATLFIIGLKKLTSPKTANAGNSLSALGMLIAIIATLYQQNVVDLPGILISIVIGSAIGLFFAIKVKMTQMPELVAILNSFGGIASALIAIATSITIWSHSSEFNLVIYVASFFGILIGLVTFSGSVLAFLKLHNYHFSKSITYPLQKYLNIILLLVIISSFFVYIYYPEFFITYISLITILSLLLGINLVLPIGGADMPVVIALMNSYSGLAAAATGFILGNSVLIIAGSLVGASGLILTQIMCRAMNRNFIQILFGSMEVDTTEQENIADIYKDNIISSSADEIAMILSAAKNVIMVPGYGMATAQAQHVCADLAVDLKEMGCDVKYAIHPVAGRMPGHMNVLLAEADVPYTDMYAMDEINHEFSQTDVVIVIGANDVVNPVARETSNSPIAGMPILNVDKAKTVVIIKRSLSPGFAGIPNPLFVNDNSIMLFDDAKKAIINIIKAIREG